MCRKISVSWDVTNELRISEVVNILWNEGIEISALLMNVKESEKFILEGTFTRGLWNDSFRQMSCDYTVYQFSTTVTLSHLFQYKHLQMLLYFFMYK